jgi:DNA-binding MarR family transcriptional regulator
VLEQYRLIHDIYVMLDDGDRRVFEPLGITLPQYRVLTALHQEQGQRLTTLSETLLRAKSTITRVVDQLEQEGLVERLTDDEDRRAQRVMLTERGVALLGEASQVHEASINRRFGRALSPEAQQTLLTQLQQLHDGLVDHLAEAAR